MSQESNEPKMRPEYDIRGGVRGKYFDQYHERPSISIKFEASTLIVESTASAQQIGHVTNSGSSLPPSPSPKIVIGQPAPVACAG